MGDGAGEDWPARRRSWANRSIRGRSGPSPTSSREPPVTAAAASTACSSAWNRRKLPTHPTTKRSWRPRLRRSGAGSGDSAKQLEVDARRGEQHPLGPARRCAAPARPPSRCHRRRGRHRATPVVRHGARASDPSPGGSSPTAPPPTPWPRARTGPRARRSAARQVEPGGVEQIVALPHEARCRVPAHGPSASMSNRRLCRQWRTSLAAVLATVGQPSRGGRVARGCQGGSEPSSSRLLRREDAVGRHHPRPPEHTLSGGGPPGRAEQSGHRALLRVYPNPALRRSPQPRTEVSPSPCGGLREAPRRRRPTARPSGARLPVHRIPSRPCMRPTPSAPPGGQPVASVPMRILHMVSHSHRRGSEMAALELARSSSSASGTGIESLPWGRPSMAEQDPALSRWARSLAGRAARSC